MNRKFLTAAVFLFAAGLPALAIAAHHEEAAPAVKEQPSFVFVEDASKLNFTPIPGYDPCVSMVATNGDPNTGPSTFMVKMESQCDTPRHWHSFTEELIILQGTFDVQVEGHEKSYTVPAGSYMLLKAKTVHYFKCISKEACILFDSADAKFDVNNVDGADSHKE